MRVLHLSTTDIHGGASRAAHRIHIALMAAGIESRMKVRVKLGDEWHVRSSRHRISRFAATLAARIKARWITMALRPTAPFSTQFRTGDGDKGLKHTGSDIVHLHWICDGFLGIKAIGRIPKPIVWTIHDQWPFTGGCHYSGECQRFSASCGQCPILPGRSETDLSRKVLAEKRRRWRNLNITIVSPSRWMAREASRSSLFAERKIHVIPNPVDLQVFTPIPKESAKLQLGIDPLQPTLLFGAMSATTDTRKGFDLLKTCLEFLRQDQNDLQILVFGASAPTSPRTDSHSTRFLGKLTDDAAVALAYSAADVFVAPSREDNLPNTVAESLACGTPVVAFRVGGMPDMINHEHNGFLAEPFNTRHLAQGVISLLKNERRDQLSSQARAAAEVMFAPTTVAAKYEAIYQGLISTGLTSDD